MNFFNHSHRQFHRHCSAARAGLHLLLALTAITLAAMNELSAAEPAGAEETKLVAVLKSETASHHDKGEACRKLAVVGTEASVSTLSALLPSEKLSHLARFALEPMPNPSAGVALRDALGTLKGRLLVGVINSIGVRRDPEAVGALTKLLTRPDPEIVSAAAAALGRIGNLDCAQALQTTLIPAPTGLRSALADGCLVCAERLLTTGNAASASGLFDVLRKADVANYIQMAALRGAILARRTAGVALLIEQLRSSDAARFAVGLRVARELAGSQVTQALAAELGKLPADNQAFLVQALGDRADTAALPVVMEAAQHGATPVRVAAIHALPRLGSGSIVSVLLDAAAADETQVKTAARGELARLSGKEVDAALLSNVNQGNATVRCAAIELAAQRRVAAAAPVLLKASADPDVKIRASAIKAIGETATVADFGGVSGLLITPQSPGDLPLIAEALATALLRAADKSACAEALLAVMPQAKPDARRALLKLLSQAGGAKALHAVRIAAQDTDAQTRESAVRALADWPDAGAAPDLLEIIKRNEDAAQRALAFRGYVRLAREVEMPVEARVKLLGEVISLTKTTDDKKLVLGALGEAPSIESLHKVIPSVSDAALADEAGAAVVKLAAKLEAKHKAEVVAALQQVVKSAKATSVVDSANAQLQRLSKPQ